MNFADSLAQQLQTRNGPPCGISVVLQSVDAKDRADIIAALDNADIAGTIIARALKNGGHKIGPSTVNRHRNGECLCERTGR